MICPMCNNEMESGFLQGAGRAIWTAKKRKVSLWKRKNGEDTILSDKRINWIVSSVTSYRCQHCGIILTPIPPQNGLV